MRAPQRRPARLLAAGLTLVLFITGTGRGLAQTPDTTAPDTTLPPVEPPPDPEPPVPPTFPPPTVPPTIPPDAGHPADPSQPADDPAAVDPAEPVIPVVDPSPRLRALLAELGKLSGEDLLLSARGKLDEARWKKLEADQELDRRRQIVAHAEEGLAYANDLLATFAVNSFMYATGGVSEATEQVHVYERKKEQQLTRTVLDHRLRKLDDAERLLDEARRSFDDQQRAVDAAAQQVAERESIVGLAEAGLADAGREQRVARSSQADLVFYDRDAEDRWQLEIAGDSVLTADEITAWFESVGVSSRAKAPVADLAKWYIEEGKTEGIRGDVAFAQAVLETGSFTNRDTILFNNFAGIGHCQACPSGFPFPTPQDGVRAQIQLLKSYVFERPEYVHPLVDRRLRGPAGCCQTWNELGGVWASGQHYGPIVLTVYQSMLEFALARRTAFPMLRPPV